MQPVFNGPPGYRSSEYLLVIDLPENLRHKIEQARHELQENYQLGSGKSGRPHLALARFSGYSMMEEKLLFRIRTIALAQKPFLVELKDFGSYPMHSLFIRLGNPNRVLQLVRDLKQARRLMKAGKEDPWFLEDPVMPLASRIPKPKYLLAEKEYSQRHFSGKFLADSLLVLRREQSPSKYQIVGRFAFQCLPVLTTQGQLF